jgi:cytoskeletal protein RodZ
MPDIGQTLRETRLRNRVDITEVEAATKIRAKYLRALENEEWDLLPGPTFVTTFLRTYADYLGLDSRVLVEEYKQRFERPSAIELTPFKPGGMGGRRDRRRRISFGPPLLAVLGILLLLGALYALGTLGNDGGGDTEPNQVEQEATPTPTATPSRRRSTAARRVSLIIVPTAAVNVCLLSASGSRLIDNQDLQPGRRTRRYRGRRLTVSFGNGGAHMLVNGRRVEVPDRSTPVGFELRAGRRARELPESRRPKCG